MDTETADKLAIRELIENWVIWRDAGDWERFRTVWHEDGWMNATWFQGPASEFIRVSREGWERGVNILHSLGGTSIELGIELGIGSSASSGSKETARRAFSQTKMTILQRAKVHDVLCDVVCTGRFCDFLEKRAGRWGIVVRQPIYEKDRIDPVDPAARLNLDAAILQRFPEGYRHLAYLQSMAGYKVKADMPGLKGPEVEALYARGRRWLAGASVQA